MKKIFENKFFIIISLFLIFGAVSVIAAEIIIDVEGITSSKGNSGMTLNMTILTDNGDIWFMVYEDGLLVNTTTLIQEYPTFSNLTDNSGIGYTEEANFNVTVADSNGTVYLNIDNTNHLTTGLGSDVHEVKLNLSGGEYEYYWFSYGNDSYEKYGASEVMNFSVIDNFPAIGLISYWDFEENSGSIIDRLGINNGTNVGATNTTGKIGDAYYFDGSNDYIEIDDASALTTNWTVSLWVFPNSLNNYMGAFAKIEDDRAGGEDFMLITHSTGEMGSGDGAWAFSSTASITTGTWYNLVWVYDKVNTRMSYYVNGVSKGTDENFNPSDTATYSFFMGSWVDVSAYEFNGKMDEVGIWNRALNSTEIQNLYNGGNGLAYPN